VSAGGRISQSDELYKVVRTDGGVTSATNWDKEKGGIQGGRKESGEEGTRSTAKKQTATSILEQFWFS